MCITHAGRAAIRSCWHQPNQSAARRTSTMVASPDQCTDQIVDGSRQRFEITVVDPASLDSSGQIPDCCHPIARCRGPPHGLDVNLARVVLDDGDPLDALYITVDDLHRREPVRRGPAPFRCPRTAGRRTPLRHAAADLDDDGPATPAAFQDLPRRAGGLASSHPIVRRFDYRLHSFITSQRNDATP